jgi:bacillopeptidase F
VVASLGWSRIAIANAYQVQLQHDGGAWGTVRLPSSLSRSLNLGLVPGHGYRARLRVRTPPSWVSPWATSATFSARRVEETSGALTWTGRWSGASGGGASGGHSRTSVQAGATATVAFTGRAIAWAAPTGPTRGAARVYVDGVYRGTVNLHRTSFAGRQLVFRAAWTASGVHALRIVVIGTAHHPRVDVDAFAIIR